jgi:hypothetical protein
MNGLDKLEAGRRQLGMATHLFLQDADPVSVNCLAAGAANILADLAKQKDLEKSFTAIALAGQTDLTERDLVNARNRYWNAFKHLSAHNGQIRDDGEAFGDFTDLDNDAPLFTGWFDYAQLTGMLPMEGQVLQVWVISMLMPERYDFSRIKFDKMAEMSRRQRKERLRRSIRWAKAHFLMSKDPRYERRSLIELVRY